MRRKRSSLGQLVWRGDCVLVFTASPVILVKIRERRVTRLGRRLDGFAASGGELGAVGGVLWDGGAGLVSTGEGVVGAFASAGDGLLGLLFSPVWDAVGLLLDQCTTTSLAGGRAAIASARGLGGLPAGMVVVLLAQIPQSLLQLAQLSQESQVPSPQ